MGGGHILEADRCAVPPGDDQRSIGCSIGQLAIVAQGKALVTAIDRTQGLHDIALTQGLLQFVEADAERRQAVRIGLDADGELLRAKDIDQRDTGNGGQALRQFRLGVAVHRGQRQGRRAQGDIKNGRIGRIDLAE